MTSSTCAAPTAARIADIRETWKRAARSRKACSRRSASSRTGPVAVSSAIQSSPGAVTSPAWRHAGRSWLTSVTACRPRRRWGPRYGRLAPAGIPGRRARAGRAGRRPGCRRAAGRDVTGTRHPRAGATATLQRRRSAHVPVPEPASPVGRRGESCLLVSGRTTSLTGRPPVTPAPSSHTGIEVLSPRDPQPVPRGACAAGSASRDEPAAQARSGFGVERGGDPAVRLPDFLRQVREGRQVLLAVGHLLPPALSVDGEQPLEVTGSQVDASEVELV